MERLASYRIMPPTKRPRSTNNIGDTAIVLQDNLDALVYRNGPDIYFWTEVSQSSILYLIELLQEATEEAIFKQRKCALRGVTFVPIVRLYIQSYGGDLFAGLSALSHIRNNRIPVETVADGMVASAATLLLLGGSVRYIMPYSHVLIHQLSAGFFGGKHQDLLDESKNASNLMQSLTAIYLSETRLGERRIKKLMAQELELTTDQCIKFGIVTALFPNRNQSPECTPQDAQVN